MNADKSNGKKRNNHSVGNAGLFYCCYELARHGWNVLPTSRNAKGVDVVIYSADATKVEMIQVKTISNRSPVPLGENPTYGMSKFVMVCQLGQNSELPRIFIMTPQEIDEVRHQGDPKKSEAGKVSFWLQQKQYEPNLNRWDLIGRGD
ncbi:MAG: hypothetical protein IPP14_04955 [Planctomycetes bacterium]|nr:hypothetical protein [Planctomycetota bacterium]